MRHVILERQSMHDTMVSGYFEMLGALTRSAEGVKCVARFGAS